jgi:hypothetical protein
MFELMVVEGVLDQRQPITECETEPANFAMPIAQYHQPWPYLRRRVVRSAEVPVPLLGYLLQGPQGTLVNLFSLIGHLLRR